MCVAVVALSLAILLMFYYFYRFPLSSCVCQLLVKFMMMMMMHEYSRSGTVVTSWVNWTKTTYLCFTVSFITRRLSVCLSVFLSLCLLRKNYWSGGSLDEKLTVKFWKSTGSGMRIVANALIFCYKLNSDKWSTANVLAKTYLNSRVVHGLGGAGLNLGWVVGQKHLTAGVIPDKLSLTVIY